MSKKRAWLASKKMGRAGQGEGGLAGVGST